MATASSWDGNSSEKNEKKSSKNITGHIAYTNGQKKENTCLVNLPGLFQVTSVDPSCTGAARCTTIRSAWCGGGCQDRWPRLVLQRLPPHLGASFPVAAITQTEPQNLPTYFQCQQSSDTARTRPQTRSKMTSLAHKRQVCPHTSPQESSNSRDVSCVRCIHSRESIDQHRNVDSPAHSFASPHPRPV